VDDGQMILFQDLLHHCPKGAEPGAFDPIRWVIRFSEVEYASSSENLIPIILLLVEGCLLIRGRELESKIQTVRVVRMLLIVEKPIEMVCYPVRFRLEHIFRLEPVDGSHHVHEFFVSE